MYIFDPCLDRSEVRPATGRGAALLDRGSDRDAHWRQLPEGLKRWGHPERVSVSVCVCVCVCVCMHADRVDIAEVRGTCNGSGWARRENKRCSCPISSYGQNLWDGRSLGVSFYTWLAPVSQMMTFHVWSYLAYLPPDWLTNCSPARWRRSTTHNSTGTRWGDVFLPSIYSIHFLHGD